MGCLTPGVHHKVPRETSPASTKHLYDIYTTPAQRLQRWYNIAQMLHECFVFAGRRLFTIHQPGNY